MYMDIVQIMLLCYPRHVIPAMLLPRFPFRQVGDQHCRNDEGRTDQHDMGQNITDQEVTEDTGQYRLHGIDQRCVAGTDESDADGIKQDGHEDTYY